MIAPLHALAKPETRQFQIDPNIIFDLIKRQAGTLAKAIVENVSNSKDASANNVWITLTTKGITIKDDGFGFASREEILRVFEVLGFVHNDRERVYGRYGIGRAQMWCFASARWVSNGFRMDVNIAQRGLDYDLYTDLPPQPGLTITGTFYQKLLTSELLACEKELGQMLRYAPLAVYLNDKPLSRDPTTEKWDHETDDAWLRLKETGELAVFNMGVLVRSYDAYHFGSGGVIVTKPGRNLTLNLARNDIIVAECSIWKRLSQFVQRRSDARVRTKRTRVSDGELENLTKRALAKEISLDDIKDIKVFTDIQGRGYTLDAFVRNVSYPTRPVTVAPSGSRLGEQAHRAKLGFVLSPVTLERFGVETVVELRQVLLALLSRKRSVNEHDAFGASVWLRRVIDEATFTDDIKTVAGAINEGHVMVPEKDWTAEEKVVLFALRGATYAIGAMMQKEGAVSEDNSYRRLYVGVSDTALAWTDGRQRIVLERKLIEQARRGITGFMAIIHVLVHEYLHDEADAGSHEHGAEFYQHFHDLTIDTTFDLGKWVTKAFASYVYRMQAQQIPLRAAVLTDLNILEHAEREALDDPSDEAVLPEQRLAA